MKTRALRLLRRLLPWFISAAGLGYVFGYAIDWRSIPQATEGANFPLFAAITAADKIMFFVVWGILQAEVIRRFVEPVTTREVIAVKGGAELLRTVNNSVADAAFLFGVSQLARGRMAAVVAVASIPFGCHFLVLLMQATIALPLLDGTLASNSGVAGVVIVGWILVAAIAVSVRLGWWTRLLEATGLAAWLNRVTPRELAPFVGWFLLFAIFDVIIQGFATRAFGVPIDWIALAARIPILYIVMSLPSLGNFGTREIAWAESFAEFGSREALIAFALWTNVIFLVMHVLIGVIFLPRAIALIREMRRARKEGERVPRPFLHDPIDP